MDKPINEEEYGTYWKSDSSIDTACCVLQIFLKGMCAYYGWQAWLTFPSFFDKTTGNVVDVECEFAWLVYLPLVLCTIIDIIWHWDWAKGMSENVHHLTAFSCITISYVKGTNAGRTVGTLTGVVETVGPVYQLMKVLPSSFGYWLRYLALACNMFVRAPFFLWQIRTTYYHFLGGGRLGHGVFNYVIYMLSSVSPFIYLSLDFLWSSSMVRTIQKMDQKKKKN